MTQKNPKIEEVASELYDKIARASGENAKLRRAVKVVLTLAEAGMATSSDRGTVAWREALESIIKVTKNV